MQVLDLPDASTLLATIGGHATDMIAGLWLPVGVIIALLVALFVLRHLFFWFASLFNKTTYYSPMVQQPRAWGRETTTNPFTGTHTEKIPYY